MSAPRVSVIIPCYNQGMYLKEAITSIQQQTYRSFEVVVVNDGSTDSETLSILEKFSQQGVTVYNTENRGLAAARNYGILHSSGEFILPLDADDRIARDYLELAVGELERDAQVGIVYGLVEFFGERSGIWSQAEFSPSHLLYENMIVASAVFRRVDWEHVGGYRESMRYGWEDWDFWLSLVGCGRRVVKIPKVMFYYRIRSDSMTQTLTKSRKIHILLNLIRNHPQLYLLNIVPFIFGLITYVVGIKR